MTDINKSIIQLITQHKSMKEICNILNISQKQLFIRLKNIINYGYQINFEYLFNSDISYSLNNKINNSKKNESNIIIPSSLKEFRFLIISDPHIGNVASDYDLIKRVYDYASKEGINIILFCGDMIEGVYSSDKKISNNIYSQIETFIKKYPYDKNIINIGILGNHDYHSLHHDGLDIGKYINNSRYDIVSLGYGEALIKILDDSLLLHHNLCVINNPKNNYSLNPKLVILGHGHMMKTKVYEKFYIGTPTLSFVSPDKTKELLPGFIDMTIHFDEKKFEFIEAHHMIITPKIYESSVSRCRIKKLFNNNDKGRK